MTDGRRRMLATLMVALTTAACASPRTSGETAGGPPSPEGSQEQTTPPETRRVDPRKGGFEIGFGEFAVTLEAAAIRPGPVTFVVRNGGRLVHGFEMESEAERDSSGSGSGGDGRFKVETGRFGPGESVRLNLDLAPGMYKIECFVANHDDLGMEILLDVRPNAPRIRERTGADNEVGIRGFAFVPGTLTVPIGTEVAWTNADPTEHTVTAEDGSFDSGQVALDAQFSRRFDRSGEVAYFCEIHPSMRGVIRVSD
jgi:plastocyanin